MSIAESLLGEYDNEMANTRKYLERVPDGKGDWKPHPKNFTLAKLANHVATLPGWAVETMNKDGLDISNFKMPEPVATTAELLTVFDKNAADGRAAIADAPDTAYFKDWALTGNGQTFFSMPRIAVLRSFMMNHLIHHRAQLGLYLRLNEVAIPGLYGPSADESGM